LCEFVAAEDPRFHYLRHDADIGMMANFWFVFRQARAPFFLWACDDDVWPLDFLEKGIAALERKPAVSAWFCQVVNVNSEGCLIRSYPSYSRLSSTSFKAYDLIKFIWEPEVMGKCLLLYAIYRREALEEVVGVFEPLQLTWGLDNAIVYAFLCRNKIIIEDDLVFQKRMQASTQHHVVGDTRMSIYPWSEADAYFRSYRAAAYGTPYARLTKVILAARWVYDRCYHEARCGPESALMPYVGMLRRRTGMLRNRLGKFLRAKRSA
jgi:hypothetical protein